MSQINSMVILHVAHVEKRPFAGVDVAVPQHIRAQQKYAKVGFINVTNIHIDGVDNQFHYDSDFDLGKLPDPFRKPDIIIFHEIYRPAFLKLSHLARKLGIPYIVVPHGGLTVTAQKQKRLKKLIGNALLFGRYIEHAIAIQCLSKRELEESKVAKEKFIGSNGISQSVRKGSFSKEGIRFLYIGRLDIQVKGLDLLLLALRNCKEALEEKQCLVYIYGPDEFGEYSCLAEMIKKYELTKVVFLHREIIGEQKVKELCNADCYIQTSRTEGMPMGVLEAQAVGLPCIVTEGTGMAELIRRYDSGWTCSTTIEGIEHAIRLVLDEQAEFHAKSNHAVRMIEENFEWGYVARNTLEIYQKYMKR